MVVSCHTTSHITMLFRRHIYVVILVLLLVTTGYHIAKKTTTWKWTDFHPVLPLIRPVAPIPSLPMDISPEKDITVLYAFGPITPKPVVRFGYHRPLHQVISRRRYKGHK